MAELTKPPGTLQTMVRCPFSLSRLVKITIPRQVVDKSEKQACQAFPDPHADDLKAGANRNFQILSPLDFPGRVHAASTIVNKWQGIFLLDRVKSTFLSVDAVTAKVRDSQNHNSPGLHPLIAEGEITHRKNVSQFVNRPRTRTLPVPFPEQPAAQAAWEGNLVQPCHPGQRRTASALRENHCLSGQDPVDNFGVENVGQLFLQAKSIEGEPLVIQA